MSTYIKGLDDFLNESEGFKKLVKGIKGVGNKIKDAITGSFIGRLLKMQKEGSLPKGVKLHLPSQVKPAVDSDSSNVEDLTAALEGYMSAHVHGTMNENTRYVTMVHPDSKVQNINTKQLLSRLDQAIHFRNEAPLLIWGPPGVGKTSIVKSVTEKHGLPCLDISLSQTNPDEFFLPSAENGRLEPLPTKWLPLYKKGNKVGNAEANRYIDENGTVHEDIGGVIFFDELTRASKNVQSVVMKLVLDRELQTWAVGSKWMFVCAANREGDDDGVYNYNSTLGNRLRHVNLMVTAEEWSDWAMTAKTEGHFIDPAFIAFLKAHTDYFYQKEADGNETVFPSPRTWTNACVVMLQKIAYDKMQGEQTDEDELESMIADNVGVSAAKKFMEFNRLVQSFPVDQIEKVYTNPNAAPLPPLNQGGRVGASKYVLDQAYALLTMVVMIKRDKTLTPKELENFVTYVERLDDPTWGQKLMAHLVEIFPDLKKPQTELGKAMLPHAAKFLIKYPGYNSGKLSAADLAKKAGQAGQPGTQNP